MNNFKANYRQNFFVPSFLKQIRKPKLKDIELIAGIYEY